MVNFAGRHFPKDLVLLSVGCYLSHALSYRDIEVLMQERSVNVDHDTFLGS